MTEVVPSLTLGSLQELDDAVPFVMPDASLFDDSLDEDFHNKVLGTLTNTTPETDDKANLDDSLCFDDEETQLPAPQAEQDDFSPPDKPDPTSSSPVHHVPSPTLNLNDSNGGDYGAVPKTPDTSAQEQSSHAFTSGNLSASIPSPVDELFPETLNETTNPEEKECIPGKQQSSQTSSDEDTNPSTPTHEDTRSEEKPPSQENSFVKVVPSFGKKKKGFVTPSVKPAASSTTKSPPKSTHDSQETKQSTNSPSLIKTDDTTDPDVPEKQSSTSNKENKLPPVQKPKFAAPKPVSQYSTSEEKGSSEKSLAKDDEKKSEQVKKKADQEVKTGAKKQEAKKQEKEAKKQEQEQKKLQKEQLKLEKEQKKAEKERLKEEKRLEQERKKAEREQKKKENELKKMEREEKKAQKQTSGKKSQKTGTPAEKSSASNPAPDSDSGEHKEPTATDGIDSSGEHKEPTATDGIDSSGEHKEPTATDHGESVAADSIDSGEHQEPTAADSSDSGEHQEPSAADSSDSGECKEPTATDSSDSGEHKEPTATDSSDSGEHKEPTATDSSDSGEHKEPSAADSSDSGEHKEPSATDDIIPTGSKQDKEATTKVREDSSEEKMDTGVPVTAEKKDPEQSIPSQADPKIRPEDDLQEVNDPLPSSTEKPANRDPTSTDTRHEAPTSTVECKDAAKSNTNSTLSSNHHEPPHKPSSVTDEKKSSQVKKSKPKAPIKKAAPKEKPPKKQKEKATKKPKAVESGKGKSGNVQQKSKATKSQMKTSSNSATKSRKRKVTESSGTDSIAESDSDLVVAEPERKRSKPTNYSGPVWVQCENPDCNKWRELKDCLDPSDIPEKWVCSMNTDPSCNSCAIPEDGWSDIGDSQEFVESPFIPGSIVWARMDGYPWWPAMVEEDPDEEAYYEMGRGNSTVPAKYHVVFFDTPVCRAWVSCVHIQAYSEGNTLNDMTHVSVPQKYKRGLKDGLKQAKKALTMSLTERVREFTFAKRYRKKGVSRKRTTCEDNEDDGSAYIVTKRPNNGSRKSARLATEDVGEIKDKLQQDTQQVTATSATEGTSSSRHDGNHSGGNLQENTKKSANSSMECEEEDRNHMGSPGLAGDTCSKEELDEQGPSQTEKDM